MRASLRRLIAFGRRTAGGAAAGPDPIAVFRRFADGLERRLGDPPAEGPRIRLPAGGADLGAWR